ncbi:hypothetical protein SAMN00808754_1924 [Thermanaeromonas toyohensis ToBE]|uniref:Uncharacterized protein n=1 Tax=Thermanaeromonas toyohensis ToBE TaxID=698762 RepID=A0A1W1VWT0_9FIRM|nr:hypothetical protein [Thermanaeromonas toyohensis]SMB97713.1 hypothetical protein SAMN00808754_1924 [Thermanaeromonas toyohensis ToBE]
MCPVCFSEWEGEGPCLDCLLDIALAEVAADVCADEKGKDLYYAGEVGELDEESARMLIKESIAEPVTCPDCGKELRETCCAFHCRDCGTRYWKE